MSRDVKSTDITGINDGLDRAINRLHRQMREEMEASMRQASEETATMIAELKKEAHQGYSQADQEELMRRIEEIQSELGAQIDEQAQRINESLLDNEARYSDALQEMSDTLYDSMIEEQERFAVQMRAWLDEQENAFAEQLDEVYAAMDEQQEQIDLLQQGVKTLFELRENEINEMRLAAGRALALLEEVRKRTPVSRFASVERREMVELLEKRIKGLQSNPASCTITDVNNMVDATKIMEKEALREQAKWLVKHNLAMTTVNALLRMMQDNIQLKVNSIYDETQQEELQTNYWTHGRFHELEEEVIKIKARVDSKEANADELDLLIDELKKKENELVGLREEAVQLGLLSENRIKMTNDILNAMRKAGWKVKKEDVGFMGGEEDNDCREGTFAILYHPIFKEKLSVIIFPETLKGDEVVNKIVFHRDNETLESEGQFLMRLEQIKAEIESKTKYKLGELCAPSRGGDGQIEQARSSAELKRKGAVKKMEELRQ